MCVQEFLDGEKKNNEEKEKSVGVLEREAAKTRLTYQEMEVARLAFKNEVITEIKGEGKKGGGWERREE